MANINGCMDYFRDHRIKSWFMWHVDKLDNGCWVWMGVRNDQGYGYSHCCYEKRAYRASYLMFKGPIPRDKSVLHNCDNRSCCSPHHLRLGTPKDNSEDRKVRDRSRLEGIRPPKADTSKPYKLRRYPAPILE